VDLLVNRRPIARGEVVVIDEEFGQRITEVVGAGAAPEPAAPEPAAPEPADPSVPEPSPAVAEVLGEAIPVA
jgi:flagellar motor switch protein FliN/FliY